VGGRNCEVFRGGLRSLEIEEEVFVNMRRGGIFV
jgi:hypothetical protein